MKWINTEQVTLESAKLALDPSDYRVANGLPIWVRWYRTFEGGNTGTAWGKTRQFETCELVGVTAKRLKVKGLHDKIVYYADPNRCYFAVKGEV